MDANRETVSLPLVSTVFTSEVMALRLASKIVRKNLVCDKYLVCVLIHLVCCKKWRML